MYLLSRCRSFDGQVEASDPKSAGKGAVSIFLCVPPQALCYQVCLTFQLAMKFFWMKLEVFRKQAHVYQRQPPAAHVLVSCVVNLCYTVYPCSVLYA